MLLIIRKHLFIIICITTEGHLSGKCKPRLLEKISNGVIFVDKRSWRGKVEFWTYCATERGNALYKQNNIFTKDYY